MSSANQIGYEAVAQAAEQLTQEGRPIGPTKIREVLGRGSFSTVQKHLQEWEAARAKLKAQQEEELKLGPPDELFQELQKVMGAYWPHAVSRAREQMKPELDALKLQLTEANARLKEASLEFCHLENKLDSATAKAVRMEEAEKQAATANQIIITMQSDLARLEKIEARFEEQKELVVNLHAQAASLTELMERNTALGTKIEESVSQLNEAHITIAKLETSLELSLKK
ncbi:MAG: DNA-binding protein [Lentisphaerae bacterium]|nr:DNA-binding protein [Lentisphaerota bacterium]